MKVRRMIELLQGLNPEAEVKLHDRYGHNALTAFSYIGEEDTVIIEDKGDFDLSAELSARFEDAAERQLDELDFFINLLDDGYTLEDIKENLPERYEYSRNFCSEHGLI